jgi:hypothetical protein
MKGHGWPPKERKGRKEGGRKLGAALRREKKRQQLWRTRPGLLQNDDGIAETAAALLLTRFGAIRVTYSLPPL